MDPEKMAGIYIHTDDGEYVKHMMNLETWQIFKMGQWEEFLHERTRKRVIHERINYERRHCPHEAQFQLYTKFYSGK